MTFARIRSGQRIPQFRCRQRERQPFIFASFILAFTPPPPPTVVWGKDWKRQVNLFTMGGLAKMPRDWTGFGEWKATTRMTAHDLRKLPELHPVAETPKVEKSVKRQAAAGSVRGQLIDRTKFGKYFPLARRFVPEPVALRAKVSVTAEDVAVFLVLLEFFGDNPNPDGSVPCPAGVLRRQPQPGRFRAFQEVRRTVAQALRGRRGHEAVRQQAVRLDQEPGLGHGRDRVGGRDVQHGSGRREGEGGEVEGFGGAAGDDEGACGGRGCHVR